MVNVVIFGDAHKGIKSHKHKCFFFECPFVARENVSNAGSGFAGSMQDSSIWHGTIED